MGLLILSGIKMLQLAIDAIEAGIKVYDAETGKDLIAEIEAHLGKLAGVVTLAKAVAPGMQVAIAAAEDATKPTA